MKKLTALLLALIMVLAMNVTAFAEETILAGNTAATTNLDNFTIDVELKKADGVNTPVETVTYSLAPAVAADVEEPYNHVGPADGIKFEGTENTATFPANASGADLKTTITVTVDNTKFTDLVPGIYRYKITEVVNNTDLGFVNDDETAKFIDVYVKTVSGEKIVYAATMSATNNGKHKALDTKDGDFTIKYTTSDGTSSTGSDSYDVTITKANGGGGAEDTDEYFKFAVSVGGSQALNQTKITVELNDKAAQYSGSGDYDHEITLGTSDASYDYKLKMGGTITLKGLPKTLAIAVTETVASVDGYTTKLETASMTTADNKVENATTNAARTISDSVAVGSGTITVTNTRSTISPTGVVLRIAPYAIMLGAGVVLFIILKSRKNKAVEEA